MRHSAKFLAGAAALALTAASISAAPAAPNDTIGTWRDTELGSIIKISPCGAGICAQLVKVRERHARDENNPDPALRARRIEGIVIMSAVKSGFNSWRGKLYNREDGQTYAGSITLLSKDQIKLEGCVAVFCKSRIWVRIPAGSENVNVKEEQKNEAKSKNAGKRPDTRTRRRLKQPRTSGSR
jgi:uncharacterized protein (DUF2147 family)